MILFCPLASGSKGNCIYLQTPQAKFLIDAGISCKQIEDRLQKIDVAIDQIDAIIVTHEHGDHIRGLDVVSRKYHLPILCNSDTAKGILEHVSNPLQFKIFTTNEPFEVKDTTFFPFSVQHDTLDPIALTAQIDQTKIGICTDLGFVSSLVSTSLKNCDILYIESNHEEELVHASARPQAYKTRVLSRQGHISNDTCSALLKTLYHDKLKKIYLAHLSSDCNTEQLALSKAQTSLKELLGKPFLEIEIAKQEENSIPISI